MIKTKSDLKYYLKQDKKALGILDTRTFPRPFLDHIWKYEIILRKYEYAINNSRFSRIYYKILLKYWSEKLSVYIPPNVFGPGLSIAHAASIVVNDNAKVGKNCRIHEGVTIGATNGEKKAAIIGDNCFIGSGAKIIGNISIGDNVAIGAGAVVVKSFEGSNITLGGVPARIISQNSSKSNLLI